MKDNTIGAKNIGKHHHGKTHSPQSSEEFLKEDGKVPQ